MIGELTRTKITGRGIPLPGKDIDTDRVIPARYLKAVTFADLGNHVFEDDRKDTAEHPFNRPQFAGASILIAGENFGCGSSREHAPQALMRWGVRAIVAVSFAEIFFSNCVILGIPCLSISADDDAWLLSAVERKPQSPLEVDVDKQTVTFEGRTIQGSIPSGARNQLVSGTWDATAVLLEARSRIQEVAQSLPYVRGM
jgi:3-isopropylmalate/(R)-2-methylmalate dehydratase small subunit